MSTADKIKRNIELTKARMASESPEYMAKRREWVMARRALQEAEALERKLWLEMEAMETKSR